MYFKVRDLALNLLAASFFMFVTVSLLTRWGLKETLFNGVN